MAMLKGPLAAVLSLAATGAASGAGAYPDKPVRLYVGFAPGGATTCWPAIRQEARREVQPDVHRGEPARRRGNIAVQALAQAPAEDDRDGGQLRGRQRGDAAQPL